MNIAVHIHLFQIPASSHVRAHCTGAGETKSNPKSRLPPIYPSQSRNLRPQLRCCCARTTLLGYS